jgi:hypothetical protein
MVFVNFLIAASWIFVFCHQYAWSGALISLIAATSSLYTFLYNKTTTHSESIRIVILLALLIIGINILEGDLKIMSFIPLLAFSIYRYAELRSEELEYRYLSTLGSALYIIYGIYEKSWGVSIGESFFVIANSYYIYKHYKNKQYHL